jgi:hypothetical protein
LIVDAGDGLFWTVSPLLINLLYDERYADAGNMLSILSLSFFMIKDWQTQKELRDSYDVCIIGAGPAGITLALRFAGNGRRVLLLEGGGTSIHSTRKASTSAHRQATMSTQRKHACVVLAGPPITGRWQVFHGTPECACGGQVFIPEQEYLWFV